MRKKIIVSLAAVMVCAGFTACDSSNITDYIENNILETPSQTQAANAVYESTKAAPVNVLSAKEIAEIYDVNSKYETKVKDYIQYRVYEDGYVYVEKYFGTGTTVTIPDKLEGYPVVALGPELFLSHTDAEKITIPDTVFSVEGVKFIQRTPWFKSQPEGIVYLNKVAVGVTGNYTLYVIDEIKEGTIGLADAFYKEMNDIKKITLPDSLLYIGKQSFMYCAYLEKIEFGDGVVRIGESAFEHCNSLTSVKLPESAVAYKNAFVNNPVLTSAAVPMEITSDMKSYAFSGCSALSSVTVSK